MAETAYPHLDRVVRVLVIDDDEDDFFLARDLLSEVPGTRFVLDWEPDWDKALVAVCGGHHEVYLVDYRMGANSGLDLIRESNKHNCSAPLILMTGQGERELDFAAMEAGAADYLEKSNLDSTLLERSIRYSIQKKQSEEQLEKRVRGRTAELAETNLALEREIRERLRIEEALRQIDRRKDEFLATLAHELRNPLAPIRNALEIMRLGGDDKKTLERGRLMMERQVAQMVRLIDDLLDISRITRGKIELRKERVNLADVVAGAVESSQPLIDAGRHELKVTIPKSPIILDGDPTRLTQILTNLLNNAAKYMDPKGKIFLSAAVEGNSVVLRVRDTGVGIAPEVLPHIFAMFSQVERSRDRAQGGLGIGLSLVRGLVELHGGSVEALSEGAGKGSEFVVRLPLGKA